MLCVRGTIPIDYANARYNIPVRAYAPSDFPRAAPMFFVTPTSDMIVKPNHGCVDASGTVALERVMRWDARTGRLSEAAAALARVFSVDPPLFSKPRVERGYVESTSPQTFSRSSSGAGVSSQERVPFSAQRRAPPGDSPRQRAAVTTSPIVRDFEEAQTWFREKAMITLNARLKAGAERHLDSSVNVIEKLLAHQTELCARKISLEQEKRSIRAMCDQLERDAVRLREETVRLQSWLDAHPEQEERVIDPEVAFAGADAVSAQLLDAHAKDSAIEDALDALDELLNEGRVDLDDYLRQVNKLCKAQFIARAEVLVVSKTQQERGIRNGLQTPSTSSPTERVDKLLEAGFDFLRPTSRTSSIGGATSNHTAWLD